VDVCPLCGGEKRQPLFITTRLEGPLVRCRACGLVAVSLGPTTGGAPLGAALGEEMGRLSRRARELSLVEPGVEEQELPWRQQMATERLDDLLEVLTRLAPETLEPPPRESRSRARLLEVGSSTGEFLLAAQTRFAVQGIEADTAAVSVAHSRGVPCFHGAIADAGLPPQSFDLAALYHVFEHFRDPRGELRQLRRLVRPGGALILETPDVETIWFRLLGERWRQIIPDHLFFFSPATLGRLLREEGWTVLSCRHVGKSMSLRLFISRIGRNHPRVAQLLSRLATILRIEDRTLRLNLGDVIRVYARREEGNPSGGGPV
jgi:SAM-dependent methyltransferase